MQSCRDIRTRISTPFSSLHSPSHIQSYYYSWSCFSPLRLSDESTDSTQCHILLSSSSAFERSSIPGKVEVVVHHAFTVSCGSYSSVVKDRRRGRRKDQVLELFEIHGYESE